MSENTNDMARRQHAATLIFINTNNTVWILMMAMTMTTAAATITSTNDTQPLQKRSEKNHRRCCGAEKRTKRAKNSNTKKIASCGKAKEKDGPKWNSPCFSVINGQLRLFIAITVIVLMYFLDALSLFFDSRHQSNEFHSHNQCPLSRHKMCIVCSFTLFLSHTRTIISVLQMTHCILF